MRVTRLLAAAALATLTACGTPSVENIPDSEADISMPSSAPADTASTAPKQTAKIGDSLTLAGSDPELKMQIKLNRVLNNAQPPDEFTTPGDGKRFYAIEVVIKNVGTKVYSDSLSNGAAVVDSEGQQYNPTLTDAKGLTSLNSATISPGDFRKGGIVFSVPRSAKITKLQLTLDSGFADATGEWLTQR